MISPSDVLLLNGINPPGAVHIWVPGDDLVDLDNRIKQLRRKHGTKETAAILGLTPQRVNHRVRQMIKRGEVRNRSNHRTESREASC